MLPRCHASAGTNSIEPRASGTRPRRIALVGVSLDLVHGSGLRADGDHPNGNSLPDYNQVNLSIVQRLESAWLSGLEARLDVINLLDEKYPIRSGTGIGVGAPQFGLRRTVLAGLKYHF